MRVKDFVGPIFEGVKIADANHLLAFAVVVTELYDAAPRYDKSVRRAWIELNRSNVEVFLKRIRGTGIKIEFTDDDPYEDSNLESSIRKMLWDMSVNNRLKIFSGYCDTHPFFAPEENKIFRVIHDYLTHGKLRKIFNKQMKGRTPSDNELEELFPKIDLNKGGNLGHKFTLRGELNAYCSHATIAPRAALPALFTEICGQVCYQIVCGDFPEQKLAILPGFDFMNVGIAFGPTKTRMDEIIQEIKSGATTLEIHVSAKPKISVKELQTKILR